MSETLFKQVNYTLASLIEFIGLGQIGLPDLQRPFVWKDAKVRDLFDSMYRGYPVGYLLFWQNALVDGARTIGADTKQKTPSLLIVDGQQRLTSLFAVVTGHKVLREDFDEEFIKIAFSPLEEKFVVADATTVRDKTFLPNITAVLSRGADIFEIASNYLDGLKSVREVSSDEIRSAQRAINRLAQLSAFPFTALELSANITEEQVAEVFVRINSQGKPLNQSDFILTLMSVFWDEGRTQLEEFSRESKIPTIGDASPYNAFIEPSPDQMLRAAIGLGFKRARLQHVYSILRGKDLQTGEFDVSRRGQQFDLLKTAQAKALGLDNWHGFLRAITGAGFRSGKMISSEVAVIYSYVLYLLGKCEFDVPEKDLRRALSRWIFMSMLTGRYSSSPEAAMDFDLANLRAAKAGGDFLRALDEACATALTPDFWSITLPSELATSAGRSPSMFAYFAALCLLDARVLFSNQRVRVTHKHDAATAHDKSEPELFVEFADRVPEWSVVIGLIGTGQEIHVGEEAGIGQWRKAVEGSKRRAEWHIHIPPSAIDDFRPCSVPLETVPALSLGVELRQHAAEHLHGYVAGLLNADRPTSLRGMAWQLEKEGFNLRISRDLEVAKSYLRERYAENAEARFGIVASSKDKELKRLGISNDFQSTKRVKMGPWYGDGEGSPLSCRKLTSCVTEFGAQGLELDAVLLGWGADYVMNAGSWSNANSSGYKRKKLVRDAFQLRLNAYRVLLTRARDVVVVFVPQLPLLDQTFEYLIASGFTLLDSKNSFA